MRYLFLLIFLPSVSLAQNALRSTPGHSPLSGYSTEWNDPKYLAGNTASNANYMTLQEKNVIYVLNLARMNPVLFCETVVKNYPQSEAFYSSENSTYYTSLVKTMSTMGPLNLLKPDRKCYNSAYCHAFTSGRTGYVGHERSGNCGIKKYYNGECCDYGHDNALDIVMSLLIDEDVPSLGHRLICFTEYNTLGVSIQPHKEWTKNAVLDFHF